jgi:hypothetical protein
VAGEEFDGIPVGELPIDEVAWSDERAKHIRTRAERKGPAEVNIEPLWASEAALDPSRLVRRGTGREIGGGAGLLAVGPAGGCWCGSTRPGIRRAAAGRAAARSLRAAGCGQHIGKDGPMTGKAEPKFIAAAEEEFERRAAADDPAGFVPHGRPPRGRAQVYSVRIPSDALAALRRLAEARGQLPSVLIRGWVLERLRQETTGGELLVSRDELARIVREQVEAALRRAS